MLSKHFARRFRTAILLIRKPALLLVLLHRAGNFRAYERREWGPTDGFFSSPIISAYVAQEEATTASFSEKKFNDLCFIGLLLNSGKPLPNLAI